MTLAPSCKTNRPTQGPFNTPATSRDRPLAGYTTDRKSPVNGPTTPSPRRPQVTPPPSPPTPSPPTPQPQPTAPAPAPQTGWSPAAALAAWALPGLGHFLLGYRAHALILATALTTLYTSGLLIGGIGVVNRQDHRWPFVGQAFLAPTFLVDLYRNRLDQHAPAVQDPDQPPPYTQPLGKPQTVGTLYTALAGMLNALVILDLLHRDPKPHDAKPRA
ncbi:MAG: DUF6677 family protein [Planctomycetota bacterium]